ncbi:hypothetical protein LCGC14_0282300 [marine sediment metagenome]|uniref:Uncharacterized protein n=1 Tax=marine sediment metagenome TaxID=412755 RepID=A0A0F9WGN7_9ZZZZ
MKISDDHYRLLADKLNETIAKNPAAATEYQAAGLSPKRLRWDFLWSSKIKIGDSIGMGPDPHYKGTTFIPIYDYANDDHIDTALRKICSEAGCDYGAAKDASMVPKLAVVEGKQFLPTGSSLAELVYKSGVTDEPEARRVCVVTANNKIYCDQDMVALLQANERSGYIEDVLGNQHEISYNGANLEIDDYHDFAAKHSTYVAKVYSVSVRDTDDEHGEALGEPDFETDTYDFDSIRSHALNVGISEYNSSTLYSTDPSGTRDHYEKGIDVYHYMDIESVNGLPATHEQIAALGTALKISPSYDMRLQGAESQNKLRLG